MLKQRMIICHRNHDSRGLSLRKQVNRIAACAAVLLLGFASCPRAFAAEPVVADSTSASVPASKPFAIEVLDDQTGRGVPLVELRTTGAISYFTDSNGIVAFDEPGLMNQRVFFEVSSHGYEFPADGFGIRGKGLDVKPGGKATLKIKRQNIAERLYRVTGGGIYRDTVLVGREAPIEHPLLNAKVIGCDSIQTAVYKSRMYWFWGDTIRPAYPLGNFNMTGATTPAPAAGPNLDRGVNLEYFVGDDGFARGVAKMEGSGPTWLDAMTVVPDRDGRERLFAGYVKIKPPLTAYRRGICVWNDDQQAFEHAADLPLDGPLIPFGHVARRSEDGVEYVFFGDPFPLVRTRATAESVLDINTYEAYTCLQSGTVAGDGKIARDESGKAVYSWKRGTPALSAEDEAKLIHSGKLKANEARLQLRDRATGKPIVPHRGSVSWNAFRKRWILIFCQYGGTSMLGEIWYAEADSPLGPWRDAVKVVTHDRYTFYNPLEHAELSQDGGRLIYFEGTYTHSFSGNPVRTPRYDYNQIMYRLDLSDPRLHGEKQPGEQGASQQPAGK